MVDEKVDFAVPPIYFRPDNNIGHVREAFDRILQQRRLEASRDNIVKGPLICPSRPVEKISLRHHEFDGMGREQQRATQSKERGKKPSPPPEFLRSLVTIVKRLTIFSATAGSTPETPAAIPIM